MLCSLDAEDTQKNLPTIAPADARQHLAALVAGYRAGQTAPLCYAPDTSAKLATKLLETNNISDDEALNAAQDSWNDPGNMSQVGEGLQSATSLAWRDTDPFAAPHDAAWLAWARAVAIPLHKWWKP